MPGRPRHDGTHAAGAETDSKVKARLGCSIQSCQKKKTPWNNARTRWEHEVEGWRELDPCSRHWGAAHVGRGQRV